MSLVEPELLCLTLRAHLRLRCLTRRALTLRLRRAAGVLRALKLLLRRGLLRSKMRWLRVVRCAVLDCNFHLP